MSNVQLAMKAMVGKMKNKKAIPEIRFKGFTDLPAGRQGTWEQRKLGDIVKEVTRNEPTSDAPIMMITANNGFIEQSERYAFNNAGESLKKYILLEKGELAYNHGASKLRPYGSCFALTTRENARIPFVYHCFSADEQNSEFLSIELNGADVENQLRKIVSSGARMDGLLNISFQEYASVSVLLPSIEEQDKIAAFFKDVDRLITLHQRKYEKLHNIKKSMLEKMFPTRLPDGQENGSNVPEIRFKGFTDLPAGRQVLGKWCIYVLECDDGSFYKGKTNDLLRRIGEHMKGDGAEHTKKHKPVKLVYFEPFETEEQSLQKEKYLKSGSGREWLKKHLQKYLPLDYSRPLQYDYYAWEQRKLGELGVVTTGNTPSTAVPEYYSDDGMIWVTPTDIADNITYETEKKLSKLGQQAARVVPKNTILVTCIASIGKNTMLGKSGSFNQQINGLTPNEKKYAPYFLFTESSLWSAQMKKSAAAGTMQIVNRTEFSELKTWIPSLDEQKEIGEFFHNLDRLITLHQRKYEKLQNIKKSMLEKMFPPAGRAGV